jgi:3-methyl-2-oxobutanoate hydroxymethyltransferase
VFGRCVVDNGAVNAGGKWTADRIRALKGHGRFACLTAYDFAFARILDEAGIPLLLVGDSLGMTVLGYETTLPVTMAQMLHHTSAVARGTRRALVVGDMPFLSYQATVEHAVANAGRFLQRGADAVKIEGGAFRAPVVRALLANGIPVMGHIGLTPQSVRAMGGFKVQGRPPEVAERLRADARALEEAGVFALVLEGMPAALARAITAEVRVPTVGIGAGADCDGQVLVLHDLLGLSGELRPKFVKRYAELGSEVRRAAAAFKEDVEAGRFPGPEHSY